MTVLGNETGVFVRGVVAASGLTIPLAAFELTYDMMRVVGAVVLVRFGVQALRRARRMKRDDEGTAEAMDGDPRELSGGASYRAGLLLNLANPAPPTPLRQWGRWAHPPWES
ncbi:LysE family transporter [Streptomyces sp. NPDC005811]|uniref:LysE family translocator n=1 Tax=Streptomyces sp. NPDC005811 TaxID=3154565 RepID=UPI00340CB7B8